MCRVLGRALGILVVIAGGLGIPAGIALAGVSGAHVEISANSFIQNAALSLQSATDSERAVSIDAAAAGSAFRTAASMTITDFPVSPQANGTIELRRARPVIDANTRFLVKGQDGPRELARPELISFSGSINGVEDSDVFLNYVNGKIIASIENGGKRFNFAPMKHGAKGKGRDHLLIADADLNGEDGGMNFSCGADLVADVCEHDHGHAHDHEHHSPKRSGDAVQADDLLEVQVAVECDSYLYVSLGRDHDAQAEYVAALFAMVSRLYEENINVALYVPYVYLYADSDDGDQDPYSASLGALNVLLGQFSSYWSQRRGAVNRDIAHLMSTYPPGGGVVGIAYTGNNYSSSLCNKSRFGGGYGVSGIRGGEDYPTLDYTSDVYVVSHEIGHNFGAPHTHNCFWIQRGYGRLIDSCVTARSTNANDGCLDIDPIPAPGTIMSYCGNINSGGVQMEFHPWVRDHMRENAERVSCVSAPQSAVVKMQHPVGNQEYPAGSTLPIRWVSARVTVVKLEYSTNGGDSWDEITTTRADDNEYMWKTPIISSVDVLIRISDVGNPAVNDVTLAKFSLLAPFVTVSYPNGGEQISNVKTIDINWDSRFVDLVQIQTSFNNGQSWETLDSDVSGGTYEWDVPDVSTDEALVRVLDMQNLEIIDQSDAPFSIGTPTVELLEPLGGEKWLLGSTQRIRWNSNFVDFLRVEYSTNGGESWNRLGFRSDAEPGFYEWNIPSNDDLLTEQGMVRLRNIDELSGEGVVNATPFFLVNTISSLSESLAGGDASSVKIVPNPAGDMASIKLTASSTLENLRISVQDLTGRTVLELDTFRSLAPGPHSFALDTSTLANGMYFVVLQSGVERLTQSLSVIR